jgi:hypothetical protein
MHSIEAVDSIASSAGRSLIAAGGIIVKVVAAGALHQVAAHGGHIAYLT